MPTFSSVGTLEHVDNWSQWLGRFKRDPINGMEIGAFEGRATLWFFENILQNPHSRMTVVDTFQGGEDHIAAGIDCSKIREFFNNNLREYQNMERLEVWQGDSKDELVAILNLQKEFFDFIYIDASHRADDVLMDSMLSWRLLKPGGTMIWDDYGWHFKGPLSEPKMAIDAFLGCFEGQYRLLHRGWQVAIDKL